jgi:hypothetical protein
MNELGTFKIYDMLLFVYFFQRLINQHFEFKTLWIKVIFDAPQIYGMNPIQNLGFCYHQFGIEFLSFKLKEHFKSYLLCFFVINIWLNDYLCGVQNTFNSKQPPPHFHSALGFNLGFSPELQFKLYILEFLLYRTFIEGFDEHNKNWL